MTGKKYKSKFHKNVHNETRLRHVTRYCLDKNITPRNYKFRIDDAKMILKSSVKRYPTTTEISSLFCWLQKDKSKKLVQDHIDNTTRERVQSVASPERVVSWDVEAENDRHMGESSESMDGQLTERDATIEQLDDIVSEVEGLTSENQVADTRLCELDDNLTTQMKDDREVERLLATIRELNERAEAERSRLTEEKASALEQMKADNARQVRELEEQLSSRDDKLVKYSEDLRLKERELDEAREREFELQKSVSAAEARVNAIEQDLVKSNTLVGQLKSENEQVEAQMDAERQATRDALEKIAAGQALERELTARNNDLAESLKNKSSELNDLAASLETTRESSDRLEKELTDKNKELAENLKKKSSELADLTASLETARESSARLKKKLAEVLERHQREKSQHELLLSEKESDQASLRGNLESLEKMNAQLTNDKQVADARLKEMDDKLSSTSQRLKAEKEELKRSLESQMALEVANLYNNLINKSTTPTRTTATPKSGSSSRNKPRLPVREVVLFSPEKVRLGWRDSIPNGAGMENLGNTCYLNSSLQALFHVPAFVNWLQSDTHHNPNSECSYGIDGASECLTCSVAETLRLSHKNSGRAIAPSLVHDKLKLICRTMVPGEPEDAHEFLRYLLEGMEKAYLTRHNATKLDSYSKETTPINQIFGGYIRTEVKCLQCCRISTTFQHFQDLLLDIQKANTLDEALADYFSQEKLGYDCEACKKNVSASKTFILERPPKVLCIQLKRFDFAEGKITRPISFGQSVDLGPYMRRKRDEPASNVVYRLTSVILHEGESAKSGHYTTIAKVSSVKFFAFHDSRVRQSSPSSETSSNAYIMMFEMEPSSNRNGRTPSSKLSKIALITGQLEEGWREGGQVRELEEQLTSQKEKSCRRRSESERRHNRTNFFRGICYKFLKTGKKCESVKDRCKYEHDEEMINKMIRLQSDDEKKLIMSIAMENEYKFFIKHISIQPSITRTS